MHAMAYSGPFQGCSPTATAPSSLTKIVHVHESGKWRGIGSSPKYNNSKNIQEVIPWTSVYWSSAPEPRRVGMNRKKEEGCKGRGEIGMEGQRGTSDDKGRGKWEMWKGRILGTESPPLMKSWMCRWLYDVHETKDNHATET